MLLTIDYSRYLYVCPFIVVRRFIWWISEHEAKFVLLKVFLHPVMKWHAGEDVYPLCLCHCCAVRAMRHNSPYIVFHVNFWGWKWKRKTPFVTWDQSELWICVVLRNIAIFSVLPCGFESDVLRKIEQIKRCSKCHQKDVFLAKKNEGTRLW